MKISEKFVRFDNLRTPDGKQVRIARPRDLDVRSCKRAYNAGVGMLLTLFASLGSPK